MNKNDQYRINHEQKILIVICGGVVQSLYCSNPEMKFDILDFDNEVSLNKTEQEKKLEFMSSGLLAIY